QPLHVRSAEAKVPEQWVFEDLLPGTNTGQRSVDENEPRDSVGMLRSKRVADHVADVMGHKTGPVDLQFVKYAREVPGLRLLVETSCRLGGQAHSPQIRHDDGVVACKIDCHGCPHVACLAVTMEQDNGWAVATRPHIYRGAVGRYFSCAEFWRKAKGFHDV